VNIKAKSFIVGTALITLASCSTYEPYSGEKQVSKATKYGVGAAVGCALLGAGESRKHARNAALGCGLAGLGAGVYMDQQEKKLREQLQATGVGVERVGDKIKLIMPGNITFDTNDYNIKGSFHDVLNDVTRVLNEYNETRIRVTGHTDSTGNPNANQKLSEERAASVREYLITQGVKPGRINAMGYADRYPLSDNGSTSGRSENRRVEIELEAV